MIRNRAWMMVLLGVSGVATAWGGDCEFSAERRLTVDAAALAELALDARAGDLEVRGEAGAVLVELRGKACASSQALLDQIQLADIRDGERLAVEVQMPELEGGWGSNQASLDLVVTLPSRLRLTLQDSSGDIEIETLATVSVRDSSGDMDIRGISGDVEVRDSSGDIELRDIRGNAVVVQDSSGDIRIEGVQGQARVEVDSSGSIDLDDIRGDASVGSDSSGDIAFERIGGNASVGRDGSGSIRASDISGDFQVDADGSGSIVHRDVGGRVSLPTRR